MTRDHFDTILPASISKTMAARHMERSGSSFMVHEIQVEFLNPRVSVTLNEPSEP